MSDADGARTDAPARTGQRIRLLSCLLLGAAAVAFLYPAPYRVLQTVGTQDNRTLDAAGYVDRRTVGVIDPPTVRAGDRLLDVIMPLQQAAATDKHAADRRALTLLLGLPGMYLLGRSHRRTA